MAGDRPTVDQYFMDMTHLVKARGTCPRRQVGAVIVKDKRVLTTGYNGAPRNFAHPIDVGCLRDELKVPKGMLADICPCLHAEQNAILQAATTGVSIEGADLFCTTQPCTQCSRMLANCGIQRVIFEEEYPDQLATGILTTAGVQMWKWDAATKQAHPVKGNTFEQAQDALRKSWKDGGFTAGQRPGAAIVGTPLPMAGAGWKSGYAPRTLAPDPAGHEPDTQDDVGEAAAQEPKARGVRDLRDDPNRADLIRRMAKEKAERLREAREGR